MKVDWKERKRFRRVWLRALRTTTEKQGRRKLGDTVSGFCCLGLGCAVNKILYIPGNGLLNDAQAFRLGLRRRAVNKLANLNDHNRLSFKTIARIITEDPNTYFIQEPTDAR